MIKFSLIFLGIILCFSCYSQDLTGQQLLEKSIKYHDPNNSWQSFHGKLAIAMSTPDRKKRLSKITMNLPKEYFHILTTKDDVTIEQILDKKDCKLLLNGSIAISEKEKKKNRLSCERANMFKNYYTYLYGLPMKLKDPGTKIDPKTSKKIFKGKEYLTLKVNYEEQVGKDTWYFYFDPKTYAMEIYQFFHVESENDGEYILLSGEETIGKIKMPKTRAWYYNKDDKYLGTDELTKVEVQ